MILQLKLKNYRSYKEETVFSLEANGASAKSTNFFEINEKQDFRLLKSAIIYGANASGKSNVIRALFELVYLILNKPIVDEKIRIYEPFLFDATSNDLPSKFELIFIGPKGLKYEYKISIHDNTILKENLDYYPNGKITNVFSRKTFEPSSTIQKGVLGDSFGKKEITVFNNQLILSKFGDDEPHEILTDVFLYFRNYTIVNATNNNQRKLIEKEVTDYLYKNDSIKKKLAKLIKGADTKINDILIEPVSENKENGLRNSNTNDYHVFGKHDVYKKEIVDGSYELPLKQESVGTQSLYSLGAEVLKVLEKGGIMAVDELDTSLHPYLTKMIMMLFHSEKTNPKNAQLIFTTHDVTLLDRDLIRRDQIWIAEKNEKGVSELFSLQDFDGLREDTPFEKWYLAGKFGGLPQIQSIESLFE